MGHLLSVSAQLAQRKLNQSIAPKNVYLFFRRLVTAPHEQTEISLLSASRWDVSALCALSTNGRLFSASFHFPVISTLRLISTDNEIISLLGHHHFEIEVFYFCPFSRFFNLSFFCCCFSRLPTHRHKGPHLCVACALTLPCGGGPTACGSSPRDWAVSIGSHMQLVMVISQGLPRLGEPFPFASDRSKEKTLIQKTAIISTVT